MLERLGLGAILEFQASRGIANMKAAGAAAKAMKKSFGLLSTGVGQVATGAQRVGRAVGTTAVVGLAAMGAVAYKTTKRAMEFETGLNRIATILPGGNREAAAWGDSIQNMGIKFGQTSRQVADGVYQSISASVPAGEALQFMDLAGRAATGGMVDMNTSVDVLTTSVNAYGKSLGENASYTERAQHASDLLLKTVERGKTTLPELAQSIGFLIPVAATAGVRMEEISAALATLTKSGQATPYAVTGISQALNNLMAPSKRSLATMKKLKIKFDQTSLSTKGLKGTLQDLMRDTGGDKVLLRRLLGSTEALRAVFALTAEDSADFTEQLRVMGDVVGTTDRQMAAITEGSGFKLKQLWSSLGVLSEKVGAQILEGVGFGGVGKLSEFITAKTPAIVAGVQKFMDGFRDGFASSAAAMKRFMEPLLNRLAPGVGSMAEKFGVLVGKILPLIPALLGVKLVAGPVLGLLSGGGLMIMGLGNAVMGLVRTLGLLRGAGGLGGLLPMLGAGPLGLIGLAVAAGGALIIASGKGAVLKDAFGDLLKALSPLWDMLKEVGGFLAETVGAAVSVAATAFREVLGPALSGIAKIINEVVLPAIRWLASALTDTLGKMASWLDDTLSPSGRVGSLMAAFKGNETLMNQIKGKTGFDAKSFFKAMEPPGAGAKGPKRSTGAEAAAYRESDRLKKQRTGWQEMARLGVGQTGQPTLIKGGAMGDVVRPGGKDLTDLPDKIDKALSRKRQAEAQKEERRLTRQEKAAQKCIEINNKLALDGKQIHQSTSRVAMELTERAGAQVTPWQRRMVLERGAVKVGA